jgi:hypothetical protein
MHKVDSFLFSCLLLAAMSCLAKEAPAPRIVDLTAGDGIRLKASYFPAVNPDPESCCRISATMIARFGRANATARRRRYQCVDDGPSWLWRQR